MNNPLLKKVIIVLFMFVLLLPNSIFASSNSEDNPSEKKEMKKPEETPVFKEASVHDPSVIKVTDTYYIFGSHLAAAKSKDLKSWETIASGVADGNKLIPNVKEELKETLDWAGSDTLWAPDVIQLHDGRFYMYYNACKGDSPRSALGVAVADQIEGPYKNLGIILKSGMWGQPSEDGTIYDATKHPNTVDPDVFFDKNGNLWMLYGSYSGGIFILKMDPQTGMPFPGQGYGKKLMGGNHSRIEGSYMLYSPESDYYYMFLSFGGLDANGGYNIRVTRSKNPDGPFYDAEGNDMINVHADPSKPLFDDRSIEPYGVKLMGNYLFKRLIGDPGQGSGIGYVSPGHNSAYYDPKTGKHFLIFHTRFPNRGEAFEDRVHEMFMNADGWPVVAPYRYAGEINEKNERTQKNEKFSWKDVVGEYRLINHGKDISAAIKEPVSIQLAKDGTISGQVSGTWKLTGDHGAQLIVDGVKFEGIFVHQWDSSAASDVLTFTALSGKGVAIWGSRLPDKKDREIVSDVQQDLSLGDTSNVFYNLTLPKEGTRQTAISWSSSHPEIVSANGIVNRPPAGSGNATVTLTATITKDAEKATKSFTVVVLQQAAGPLLANYSFSENNATQIMDSSGNGYHGAIHGGISWNAQGKNGGAIDFNGTDGYVQLPGVVTDTENFTFAAWVNWKGGAAWQRIFDFGSGMTSYMFLTPSQNNGTLRFTIHENNQDQTLESSTPLPMNQWVHVTVTIEGNTGKLYINGELKAKNTNMSFNPNELLANEAYLGKSRFAADAYFNGSMDDVQIYKRTLSQQEVLNLSGSTLNPMRAEYLFDNNVTSDTSGNQYNGTVFGNVNKTVNGKIGAAAEFDGSSSYLKLPSGVADTEAITVTSWVYWGGGGAWQRIFDFGGSGGFMFLTPSTHDGKLLFSLWNGVAGRDLVGDKLPVNQWTHVAVTLEGNTAKLYVNGQLTDTNTTVDSTPLSLSAGNNFIGKSQDFFSDPTFKGKLDEFRVYNYALTQEQIQAIIQ